MVAMKHDEFFRKHPVFTGEELNGHLSSGGKVGKRTRESLLAYHRKAGRVVRVRRGLYAVVPPGADADTWPVDPFLVAARLTPDAVLSHHTALEFYGKAHSVRTHFVYSASRPLGPFVFRSHVFRGTRFPLALIRAGKEHAGVSTAERAGLEIRIASLERTLVDIMDRPELSGGWEEIWRSLESVEFFDLDKVVEYVLLLGNSTTGAKVGFFLEQHRESLMVEDRHLEALRELRPGQPHYLDRARRRSGRLAPGWNLVVPRELLERSWREVL
jgi:predicted transcriptional regulator of viral defense system